MTSYASPPSRPAPPPPSRPAGRHYPHIHDLVARTNGLRAQDRASIKSWLQTAKEHWAQARAHKTLNRIDAAYVDFLMAFTIVASVIPECAEYPTFRAVDSSVRRELETLRTALSKNSSDFENIKRIIMQDNEASGVKSAEEQLAGQGLMENSGRVNGPALRRSNAQKPELRNKPDYLRGKSPAGNQHGRSISIPSVSTTGNGAAPSSLDLESRFNKLALDRSSVVNSVAHHGHFQSIHTDNDRPTPQGPREMPGQLPPLSVKALPQLPAPTYSPATSYASPGGISPPRSSRSSLALPRNEEPVANGHKAVLQEAGLITAEELFQSMKASSGTQVLLLDVRSRDEFNQGHIFGRSVVCIEPITLREGMSAEEVEDSLVLTTGSEEQLFKKRDIFDIVVYYDQQTQANNFLHSAPINDQEKCLRNLHYALWEYAYRKKLKKPPRMLAGGLDAWVDFIGPQSLKTTQVSSSQINQTSTRTNLTGEVAGRVLPSQHLNSNSSGANGVAQSHWRPILQNKVAPPSIDFEEEQRWLDQLQRESDPLTMTVPLSPNATTDDKTKRRGTSLVSTTSSVPYPRTVEEFFQRYPASPHGRESMTNPTSPNDRNTIIDHPFHVFSDVRNPDFHPPAPPIRPPPALPRKSYSGVSERPGPATPPPMPIVSLGSSRFGMSQPNLSSSFGNGSIGRTGLKNLGNTCYMNSIIQCLSGTIPLARYFLGGNYKGHINKENPMGSRGVLVESFATVIRHLWSGEYKFISPVTFKDVSGRLNETFSTNDQQDAQEFLEFLLDGLHEDLNPNANRTKLKTLTEEEERKRETMPVQLASQIEWRRYTHQNNSAIVNWIQGQLASKLRCLTCGTTSTTYTPFMSLTIPIPHTNSKFSLYDCLQEFTKEEILDGDDAWNCNVCKQPRKATKELTITRLPMVLIIHLKRFATRGRWGDKLNTLIEFPLVKLDLTKYVPPPLENQPTDHETTPPFIYDLYGVVNHYGTLSGGHYTSYVKDSYKDAWNSFDDSKATTVDESTVMSRNAYVMFWVRKGVM